MLKKNRYSTAVRNKKDSIQAILMVIPGTIGFVVFTYFPIFYILRYAFYSYNGYLIDFVGLSNFVRLFTRDANFWVSIYNTFILSFGKLAIEIPLALLLAILLNQNFKGTAFFRVVFFLPAIISTAIVGLIFSLMFATYDGIINGLLQNLSMIKDPINWFGNKWTALSVLGIASIWQNVGVNMIFFLVALQGIPKELYECSSIDGTSSISQFWHITLPMIGPMFQMILLMAIIGSLKVADLVLVSTNGQPGGSTEVVMTYIFKYFFGYSGRTIQIGYASAQAVVTGIMLAGVSLIYLKGTKKLRSVL